MKTATSAMVMFLAAIIGLACDHASRPAGTAAGNAIGWTTVTLPERDSAGAALELLVPFYEGILVRRPQVALPEEGLATIQLSYPGPLSAPFIAWRYGGNEWTAMYADDLDVLPVQVDLAAHGKDLHLALSCKPGCTIRRLKARGSWEDMVRNVRTHWPVKGPGVRLGDRFDRIDFYVHQWISAKNEPALRTDWTVEQLRAAMATTPDTTLVQVYGLDPGGVDLGGRHFWFDAAGNSAARIVSANTNVSHLAWLNLRTLKYDIPRLGLKVPLTPALNDMAKLFNGKIREDDNYSYKAIDMCIADKRWQESRIRELNRLIDAGFKVIQLDEFPVAPVWHVAPCESAYHLHRPGDAADEWAHAITFVKELSRIAQSRGVLLTCEEPSAALFPYVSGYIDREYNDSSDLYWMAHRSALISTVPAFSTMFGDLTTPYTDSDGAEPARTPPKTWLRAHKIVRK